MTKCTNMQGFLEGHGVMDEHFPYVVRGTAGEYIIPRDKIHDFVMKYLELADKDDHLEHLQFYRSQGRRIRDGEIDD